MGSNEPLPTPLAGWVHKDLHKGQLVDNAETMEAVWYLELILGALRSLKRMCVWIEPCQIGKCWDFIVTYNDLKTRKPKKEHSCHLLCWMQTQPSPKTYDKILSINNLGPDCSFVSSGSPYASAALRVGLDMTGCTISTFVLLRLSLFGHSLKWTHQGLTMPQRAGTMAHFTLTQKTQKLPFFF